MASKKREKSDKHTFIKKGVDVCVESFTMIVSRQDLLSLVGDCSHYHSGGCNGIGELLDDDSDELCIRLVRDGTWEIVVSRNGYSYCIIPVFDSKGHMWWESGNCPFFNRKRV